MKKPAFPSRKSWLLSRGGRIRTYGLVVPNDARYRAALHPEKYGIDGATPRREFPILSVVGLKKPPTRRSGAKSWGN